MRGLAATPGQVVYAKLKGGEAKKRGKCTAEGAHWRADRFFLMAWG